MIDLHCHVLPGLDDGPMTVQAAIDLARGAQADGIKVIAATPHVNWSYPAIDAARIRATVRAFQRRLDTAGVGVTIISGAEVAATRAVELGDRELYELTLGRSGWLLLECPLTATLAPGFEGVARRLAARGHHILLAHPERSPLFLRNPDLLEELVSDGMLAQLTARALTGRFGRTPSEFAHVMIQRGTVHVVASDGHGRNAPATLAAELTASDVDPATAAWLTQAVPAALIAGHELPARPEVARRGRGGLLRRAVKTW